MPTMAADEHANDDAGRAGAVSFGWMARYSAARMGVGMHDIFFNSLAAFYLASYGLPNIVQGFLANERSLIGSPLQPVVGAISDRLRTPWGRRRPLLLLAVPVVLGFVILMSRPPVEFVIAIFLLAPICIGLAVTAYEVLLADCVKARQRGTVNGFSRMLGFVTSIILMIAAASLWATQPAIVFVIVAIGLGLGFAVTGLTISEPRSEGGPSSPTGVGGSGNGQGFREHVAELLRYPAATRFVTCYFFFWFGLGGITPFITRFANVELGIPEGETLILLIVALVATMLAVLPAGILGDHVGKKPVTLIGLIGFGIVILVSSQLQTLEQAIVALALAGLAQAVPTALAFPLFSELVPRSRIGELTGVSTMVSSMAQPLGATLLGGLADVTGSLRTVLLGGAICILIAAGILHTVRAPTPVRG